MSYGDVMGTRTPRGIGSQELQYARALTGQLAGEGAGPQRTSTPSKPPNRLQNASFDHLNSSKRHAKVRPIACQSPLQGAVEDQDPGRMRPLRRGHGESRRLRQAGAQVLRIAEEPRHPVDAWRSFGHVLRTGEALKVHRLGRKSSEIL